MSNSTIICWFFCWGYNARSQLCVYVHTYCKKNRNVLVTKTKWRWWTSSIRWDFHTLRLVKLFSQKEILGIVFSRSSWHTQNTSIQIHVFFLLYFIFTTLKSWEVPQTVIERSSLSLILWAFSKREMDQRSCEGR